MNANIIIFKYHSKIYNMAAKNNEQNPYFNKLRRVSKTAGIDKASTLAQGWLFVGDSTKHVGIPFRNERFKTPTATSDLMWGKTMAMKIANRYIGCRFTVWQGDGTCGWGLRQAVRKKTEWKPLRVVQFKQSEEFLDFNYFHIGRIVLDFNTF